MSRELFKMNMIASVQKLDNEDIEIIQNYIETIEQENKQLKAQLELYKDNHEYLNNKIDKAIEYIKQYSNTNYLDFRQCEIIELLEILGEKE